MTDVSGSLQKSTWGMTAAETSPDQIWRFAMLLLLALVGAQWFYDIIGGLCAGESFSLHRVVLEFATMSIAKVPVVIAMVLCMILLPRAGLLRWAVIVFALIITDWIASYLSDVVGLAYGSGDVDVIFWWLPRLGSLVTDMFPLTIGLAMFEVHIRGVAALEHALGQETRRVAVDAELSKARAQLLDAQIEPHFLFNTLANLRRLEKTDPAAGRDMLDSLIRFIELSLPSHRKGETTLRDEFELLKAYLDLHRVRMGDRLSYRLDFPSELLRETVPAMMLLTLIENAIKHGIAPLPNGGNLSVSANASGSALQLRVADTGRGIVATGGSGSGIGLANIRARLQALYGNRASMSMMPNHPQGFVVSLVLPLASPQAMTR